MSGLPLAGGCSCGMLRYEVRAAPFMVYNDLRGEPPTFTLQVVRDDSPDSVLDRMIRAKNELGVEVSVSQAREASSLREPPTTEDRAPGAPAGAAAPVRSAA